MSEISETSFWLNFFTDAGIPPSDATGYAITFIDNRIKQPMLLDLNKEYLRDMGISVMGDIIAILKHAKKYSGQLSRQKVFPSAVASNPPQTPHPTTNLEAPAVKKSTAATRMLEHYVRKEPPPPPSSPSSTSSNLSPSLSARLGGTKRSMEEEEPSQSNKKSSVFNRLGDNSVSSTTSDSPKITITLLGKDKMKAYNEGSSKSFSRAKMDEYEMPTPLKEERTYPKPLQYHGILKYSTKELAEKSKKQKIEKRISSSPNLSQSKGDTSSIRSRLGAVSKPVSKSEGIFAHEVDDLFESIARKSKVKNSKAMDRVEDRDSLVGKNVITKIVKIDKKTGQIVQEEKREIKSTVFNRLGK